MTMIERLKYNCVVLICLFTLSGCMARYGAVTITTVPAGAEIIDAETEEVLGITPFTALWKDSSSTRQYIAVRLKKQGYQNNISHFWLSMRHKSEKAAREEPKEVTVELDKK